MVEAGDQPSPTLPAKKEPSLAESLPLSRWSMGIQTLIPRVDQLAGRKPYSIKLAIAAISALEAYGEDGQTFAFYLYGVKSPTPEATTSLLERIGHNLEDEDLAMIAELATSEQLQESVPPPDRAESRRSRSLSFQVVAGSDLYQQLVVPHLRRGQLPENQAAVAGEIERISEGPFHFSEEDIRAYAQWNVGRASSLGFENPDEKSTISKHAPFTEGVVLDTPIGKKRVAEKTIRLAQQAQALIDQGLTVPKIARLLNKHHTTIYYSLELLKYFQKRA